MRTNGSDCVLCGAKSCFTGASFGIDGRLCRRCFNRLYGRRRRGLQPAPTVPNLLDRPIGPCALCGTTGGSAHPSGRTIRIRGTLFGISGRLCHDCFERLYNRKRAGRDVAPETRDLRRRHVLMPCVACGTEGGRKPAAGKSPWRLRGEPFGLVGAICHGCFNRLNYRRRRARELQKEGMTP